MSLPDLLLKESLFRVPAEGTGTQRQSLRSKLSQPLNNPLIDKDAADILKSAKADAVADLPTAADAGDASPASAAAHGVVSGTSASDVSISETPAENLPEQRPQDSERRLVIPEALRTRLESLYNASQLAALEDSLKVEGVTLIQGPPGTGKTSTIVGVVSVILHAQLQGEQYPQAVRAVVGLNPKLMAA